MGGCYTGLSDFDGRPGLGGLGDDGADSASDDGAGESDGEPAGEQARDPGRVTMHRLTNREYDNTIRDLFFGLPGSPSADFPADEVSLGFDNISDVLSVTPVLFELYERAAEQVVAQAMGSVSDQILTCTPAPGDEATCADQILRTFGKRAWRRPLTDGEVDGLVDLVDEAVASGQGFSEGIALGLQALLVSPHFLFRVELDPDPTSTEPHLLSDYELASRLSYFLWSTMPDEELMALADAGELGDPGMLEEQVVRMLEDPRSEALVTDFAGQWLYLRVLDEPLPKDYATFPEFDDELQASMKTEAELFFRTFITEGRSLRELLTAKDTFVDARLAEHYGLPAPQSDGFERVSLEGLPRRGFLTQAGVLSVLSHAAVTSPVKRGKWVLSQLMCITPPPPPPGVEVPPFEPGEAGSMREQLEKHREDPTCAACHDMMDPIGLSFEHYDAVGRYRESEVGLPIDASGTLPTGEPFDDALDLVEVLADSDDFVECTARKTMTYALGRAPGVSDIPYLDDIVEEFEAADTTLEGLLVAVVTSDTFRMRRGEEQ